MRIGLHVYKISIAICNFSNYIDDWIICNNVEFMKVKDHEMSANVFCVPLLSILFNEYYLTMYCYYIKKDKILFMNKISAYMGL